MEMGNAGAVNEVDKQLWVGILRQLAAGPGIWWCGIDVWVWRAR